MDMEQAGSPTTVMSDLPMARVCVYVSLLNCTQSSHTTRFTRVSLWHNVGPPTGRPSRPHVSASLAVPIEEAGIPPLL
jgi:hypothetical protein